MEEHRRGYGWYSRSVLARVLQNTCPPSWRMLPGRVTPQIWSDMLSGDTIGGVMANVRDSHWTCICKESGGVFYVDSKHAPVLLAEKDLRLVLALHPDAYLVVRAGSRHE